MTDLRAEKFILFAGGGLGGQRGRPSQLRGPPTSCRAHEHEAAGRLGDAPRWWPPTSASHSSRPPCAPTPLAGVVSGDVADAATVDLALVWRADETNPPRLVLFSLSLLDAPLPVLPLPPPSPPLPR